MKYILIIGLVVAGLTAIAFIPQQTNVIENTPQQVFQKKDAVDEAQKKIQEALEQLNKEQSILEDKMSAEVTRHNKEVDAIQAELDRIELVRMGFTQASTPVNN
jgi:predicted PurR-regulated permease PerM